MVDSSISALFWVLAAVVDRISLGSVKVAGLSKGMMCLSNTKGIELDYSYYI